MKTRETEKILQGMNREDTKEIVLLHSGGADSTASAILLKKQGYSVFGLFVNYGQPNIDAEYLAACRTANILEFPVECIDLRNISVSQKWTNDEIAFVPGRNTLFMMFAGIKAFRLNADGIAIGFMKDDMGVFGDNDPMHHALMSVVLSKSLSRKITVLTPLSNLWKKEVIALLEAENLLDNTVSCWNAKVVEGQIEVCGDCAQCKERNQ